MPRAAPGTPPPKPSARSRRGARGRRRADSPLPARQRRSQQTLDRLLTAGEEVLGELGPDGATLRAIAERAGLSVGIVYRRFPDKDTLLRAAYMRFFERAVVANEAALGTLAASGVPLPRLTRRLVEGMASGYQQNPALLRALLLYARTHDDPEFRRRAEAVNAPALEGIAALLAARADALGHSVAPRSVARGLSFLGSILQDRLLFSEAGVPDPLIDQAALPAELTRLLLRYLGLPEE